MLIRATFRGWFLPTLMVGLGLVLVSNKRLQGLLSLLRTRQVILRTRQSGLVIRTPLLDAWPAFEVFAFGEYDFPAVSWSTITSVIDCGANVGCFSLWVAQRTNCEILAIEPNPWVQPLLGENLSLLGPAARILPVAVAGSRGERSLYDGGFPAISSIVATKSPTNGIVVDAITLADLVSGSGFERVDLLKMDIEGAEGEVFRSVPLETLRRIDSAIIECHPAAGVESRFIADKLLEAGFEVAFDSRIVLAWRHGATGRVASATDVNPALEGR
jgi:FkbM family methyltransferase